MPSGATSSTASLPPSVHATAGAVGGAFATLLCYPLELIRVEIQAQGNSTSAHKDDNETSKNESIVHDSKPKLSRTESDLECFIRLYKRQALYRGASSMVTTMLISSFITFYALEVTRKSLTLLKKRGNRQQRHENIRQMHKLHSHLKFLEYILPKSKMATSLLASTLTGIMNVFLTTPLWNGTRRIMESDVSTANISPAKVMKQPSLWEMMQHIALDEGILQLWHGTWSSLLLVSNPVFLIRANTGLDFRYKKR